MSQSVVLNWSELQSVLEPFIRQIVQEELTKLVKTTTSPDKLARKRILLNTSVWTVEEVSAIEQAQQGLSEWQIEKF